MTYSRPSLVKYPYLVTNFSILELYFKRETVNIGQSSPIRIGVIQIHGKRRRQIKNQTGAEGPSLLRFGFIQGFITAAQENPVPESILQAEMQAFGVSVRMASFHGSGELIHVLFQYVCRQAKAKHQRQIPLVGLQVGKDIFVVTPGIGIIVIVDKNILTRILHFRAKISNAHSQSQPIKIGLEKDADIEGNRGSARMPDLLAQIFHIESDSK